MEATGLPDDLAGRRWRNLLTGTALHAGEVPAERLFDGFPVALPAAG